MLADPCADPGILPGRSRPGCQKTALTTVFVFFVLNFYSFTVAYQWFISKKNIILQGFGGGEGGSNLFQWFKLFPGGGGWRPNANSRYP